MTSAYILILAVLLLGGILAIVGDRIGTKVGKARLRLFNLRPKKTAAVVAVMTGTLISGSTLGILFALSETLRDGVFRLDSIRRELRTAESDLDAISSEKEQVDTELSQVTQEKYNVERDFKQIRSRYVSMTQQAGRLRQEVRALRGQRETLLKQIPVLQQQVRERDSRIASQDSMLRQRALQLQTLQGRERQLQGDVEERDRRINKLDSTIAKRDQVLNQRENEVTQLAEQRDFLQQEVATLEQFLKDYQDLREGNLALVRGEVLSFGVLRIENPAVATEAVEQLLRAANQKAILSTRPFYQGNFSEPVVQITEAQVEQMIAQIQDGQDYVVRILSAGNYVEQEEIVQVFGDVALNTQVFDEQQVVAALSIDRRQLSEVVLRERVDTLLAAAQFRARRSGILGNIQIEDGQFETFFEFLNDLNQLDVEFDQIQAIALDDTATAGPLRLQLVVSHRGTVVLRS